MPNSLQRVPVGYTLILPICHFLESFCCFLVQEELWALWICNCEYGFWPFFSFMMWPFKSSLRISIKLCISKASEMATTNKLFCGMSYPNVCWSQFCVSYGVNLVVFGFFFLVFLWLISAWILHIIYLGRSSYFRRVLFLHNWYTFCLWLGMIENDWDQVVIHFCNMFVLIFLLVLSTSCISNSSWELLSASAKPRPRWLFWYPF